jgi:hypothetical protein
MNEFGNNIIAEIKRQHVEQIEIHGVIGECDVRQLNHLSMLKIELGNNKMMRQRVSAHRGDTGEKNDTDNQPKGYTTEKDF